MAIPDHYIHFGVLFAIVCYMKKRFGSSLFIAKKNVNDNQELTNRFYTFQRSYVLIFLTVMGADWMQGPYVYELYSKWGYSRSEIAALFVMGFGTAGVCGTFIGGLTDRFGRKLTCLSFCVLYSISCITKHFHAWHSLLLGRFLGGVSTAILFSAFESWMVTHHHQHHFPGDLLNDTFTIAWNWNSIVAVIAGIITSYAVKLYESQNIFSSSPAQVAAFDCSMIALMAAAYFIHTQWAENYGDSKAQVSQLIARALRAMRQDKRIILLGLVQSCFESAMYMFVFMWTPALEETSNRDIDHGWIFSNFMLSCMVGTDIFGVLCKQWNWQVEKICLYNFGIAACVMFVVFVMDTYMIRLLAFFLFEVCVGAYFPAIGSLRSKYIPDDVRATVMNMFRVPLNVVVVLVLFYVDSLGMAVFRSNRHIPQHSNHPLHQ